MERFEAAVRAEADLIRRDGHDEARTLRQELTDNSRGFQETALKMFHGLGEGLGSQIKDFGGSVEGKLNESATKQAAAARELREEMTGSFLKIWAPMYRPR